jgi:hypothetical protein
MGKSNKSKRHFLDDSFDVYRGIRKPMPKPSRVISSKVDDISRNRRFDWREIVDGDDDDDIG